MLMGLGGHIGGAYGAGALWGAYGALTGPLWGLWEALMGHLWGLWGAVMGHLWGCPTELMFLETSALTGENVEEAFLKCARTILNKIESGEGGGWGLGTPPPRSSVGFGVPPPFYGVWGPPTIRAVGFGVAHPSGWVSEGDLCRCRPPPPFTSMGFGVPPPRFGVFEG